MELQDYLRMLKRGWPTVLIITILFMTLAAVYVAIAPRRYEAATSLLVSTNNPRTVDDLQHGLDFMSRDVATYADIVDSPTVLTPVAEEVRPQLDVTALTAMVVVAARENTTLMDIAVQASDPTRAAALANAVATSAVRVLPTIDATPDGVPLVRVTQTSPAVEPTTAISPNVRSIMTIGFVVGLCVGLAVTIAAQSLDTRIRRTDNLREITDVPLVATLPQTTRAQRRSLAVRDAPDGMLGEAFRTLRTNLRFLESRERRSLLVAAASDVGGDAATVPANLAWSLAQAGRRVLLVDVDAKRGEIGPLFGMEPGQGLTEILSGRTGLPAVMRSTQHPGLRVLLPGTVQSGSADLLSAPAMTALLRRMEQENDYVVLHVPPVLASTDAAVLSGAVSGTLITVASGRTRAHDLTTALGALANVGVKPLGMVLTGLRGSDKPDRAVGNDGIAATASATSDAAERRLRHPPAQPA